MVYSRNCRYPFIEYGVGRPKPSVTFTEHYYHILPSTCRRWAMNVPLQGLHGIFHVTSLRWYFYTVFMPAASIRAFELRSIYLYDVVKWTYIRLFYANCGYSGEFRLSEVGTTPTPPDQSQGPAPSTTSCTLRILVLADPRQ